MASLAAFLKTGSLGPLILGMAPAEVFGSLGPPDEQSQKKNPLTVKYGSLQLIFWRSEAKSQLTDMSLNFLPVFEPLPALLAFSDFDVGDRPTEACFQKFIDEINYPPAFVRDEAIDHQIEFLSGVTVSFSDGMLDSMRYTQKNKTDRPNASLSDQREPSYAQIIDMMDESNRALKAGATRSALIMSWAALEASLRRAALHQGLRGQIGVQPSVLIRQLMASNMISAKDSRRLEEYRQLRTASVHGLAPVEFQAHTIAEMNSLSRRLLDQLASGDFTDHIPNDMGGRT